MMTSIPIMLKSSAIIEECSQLGIDIFFVKTKHELSSQCKGHIVFKGAIHGSIV